MRFSCLLVTAVLLGWSSTTILEAQRREAASPGRAAELPLSTGARTALEGGSSLIAEDQNGQPRWTLRGNRGELLRAFPPEARAYRDAEGQITIAYGRGTFQAGRAQPPASRLRAGRADASAVTTNAVAALRGARARLGFAKIVPDAGRPLIGASDLPVYRSDLTVSLAWEATNPESVEWRWQVGLQPFPEGASLDPPGLLKSGPAKLWTFDIPLGSFPPLGTGPLTTGGPETVGASGVVVPGNSSSRNMRRADPNRPNQRERPDMARDLYIRIIPLRDGKPAGFGSNTVIAHYQPGETPSSNIKVDPPVSAELVAMQPLAKVYQLAIVDFRPMIFEDPNRWGCVAVLANPYYGQAFHILGQYKPGTDVCPKVDPAHKEKTTWQWIETGVTGWVKSYEVLSDFYNQAKSWVAARLADQVPCAWLGEKMAKDCESVANKVADTGLSAGMAAAGVPPHTARHPGAQGPRQGEGG